MPADLERSIDRALKALPSPRAPRTLLPRVMAAVEQSLAPWYSRGWTTWPAVWQLASAAALVLLIGGFVLLVPATEAAVSFARTGIVPVPSGVIAFADRAGTFVDAARILWRVMVEPVMSYIVALVFVMTAACFAFGTALNRVALGGASDL